MTITQRNAYSTSQNLANLANNVDYNRLGTDKSIISVNFSTAVVTIKTGTLVDCLGNLYAVTTDETVSGASGFQYIHFDGTAFTLSTDQGVYDNEKVGYYDTATGLKRVLRWVVDSDEDLFYSINDSYAVLKAAGPTTWTAQISKLYMIEVQAKGGNGGSATYSSGFSVGGGGGSGSYGKAWKYIEAGTTWTATFQTTSGGGTSITDGITTLTTQNGVDGTAGVGASFGSMGAGGSLGSGFDVSFAGGGGAVGGSLFYGGEGSCSKFGPGGFHVANSTGQSTLTPGAGGGGGAITSAGTNAGGSGGPGIIIITG